MTRFVCLFGLSANPPTGQSGHLGIVKHLASLPEFDEVRVLPVYSHMFMNKRKMLSFEKRFEMCRLTFDGIPKVVISKAEKNCFDNAAKLIPEKDKSSIRVGTADLLEMLMEEEPATQFSLALGRDTFMDLTSWKWRRSRDILSLLQRRILVIHRLALSSSSSTDEINNNDLMQLRQRVNQINDEIDTISSEDSIRIIQIQSLSHVSSTLVRETSDPSLLQNWVTKSVLQYIQKHKLYAFHEDSS